MNSLIDENKKYELITNHIYDNLYHKSFNQKLNKIFIHFYKKFSIVKFKFLNSNYILTEN